MTDVRAREHFIRLNAENCQWYCDKLVENMDAQVQSFIKELRSQSEHQNFKLHPDYLDVAAHYVATRVELIPRTYEELDLNQLPIWVFYEPYSFDTHLYFSDRSIDLIDKLLLFYIKVQLEFIDHAELAPQTRDVGTARYDVGGAYYPVIWSKRAATLNNMHAMFRPYVYIYGIIADYQDMGKVDPNARTLKEYFYERVKVSVEKKLPPPKPYDGPYIVIETPETQKDWRGGDALKKGEKYYEVGIPEGAEAEDLSQEDFDSLEDHFESIDGIIVAFHYDRESFQIKTTLSKTKTRNALEKKYRSLMKKNKQ